MRVVIVQYAGDFREAARRIESSGAETYYAQKYSIDAVAALVGRCEPVTVLCCLTAEPYDEVLSNGVRAIGAGFTAAVDERKIVALTAALKPDRLILRTPMRGLFAWAAAKNIRTIAIFADAFPSKGMLNRLRSYRWARLLNRKSVEWVFNHGLNACLSLQSIGVDPAKVIPWDWPAMVTPHAQPKKLAAQGFPRLFYAGLIAEAKGVGDLLDAVAILKRGGVHVRLSVAGSGEVERFAALADDLKIGDRVQFLGLVAHSSIQERMREADLVIVPSRHEYAEGFPMTIYETLCSRTPLIASDHPMFRTNLRHEKESLIFSAGDALALAASIERALTDAALYERLSAASAASWHALQLPVKWGDAIERWLFDAAAGAADEALVQESWLFQKRLSSGIYPARSLTG